MCPMYSNVWILSSLVGFLHFTSKKMYYEPCNQKRSSAYQEDDVISCYNVSSVFIIIEYEADKYRKRKTSNSANHSAKAYNGTHRRFRKHIRNDCKNICTPCLICRNSKADQRHYKPHVSGISCNKDG